MYLTVTEMLEQISNVCDSTIQSLIALCKDTNQTKQFVREIQARAGFHYGWRDARHYKPLTDNEVVVVRTKSGAMYFDSTINGQFMRQVESWYPLPPKDEESKTK